MPPLQGFQPARADGKAYFATRTLPTVAAQAFKDGALLTYGAGGDAGKVTEAGANPAAIVGTAMQPAFSNPGNELGHASQIVTVTGGQAADCTFASAGKNLFMCYGVNGVAGVIQTPAQINVGVTYGVIRLATGIWYLDTTVTGGANDRVRVDDIDIDNKIFFVSFLPANVVA